MDARTRWMLVVKERDYATRLSTDYGWRLEDFEMAWMAISSLDNQVFTSSNVFRFTYFPERGNCFLYILPCVESCR